MDNNKQKALVCKICGKRFKGGKAMGGHMRSHLAKLPLPPKHYPPAPAPATPSPPQHLAHYFHTNKSKILQIRNLNSTVMQTMTMHSPPPAPALVNTYLNKYREVADVTMAAAAATDESDDSAKKPRRRRSKRCRKMVNVEVAPPPQEVSCSVITNEAFSSEDCAISLMMLARDTWKVKKNELGHIDESDREEKEKEDDYDDHGEEEEEEIVLVTRATPKSESLTKYKGEGKYKCDTCKKAFQSYQALGGHRASHKRLRIRDLEDEEDDVEIADDDASDDEEEEEDEEEVVVEVEGVGRNGIGGASGVQGYKGHCGIVEFPPPRVFECPICFKQFDSGQALGGHKKVHYYSNTTNTSYNNAYNNNVASTSNTNTTNNAARASSSSANYGGTNLVIDLNLPWPATEEELDFSTVSE